MSASPPTRTPALGRTALAVAVLVLGIALYSVHASLPSNALHLPFADVVDIKTLLPQGWGYFSGDARQPVATAYLRDDGGWRRLDAPHQGAPALLLGLDRSGRLPEKEIGYAEAAAKRAPVECRDADLACLADLPEMGEGENPVVDPQLCGDVAVVRRDPLPWAWADSAERDRMPATVVRVELSC